MAGLLLGVSVSAQVAKPALEGVPVEAAAFGENWSLLFQIANRTFGYGNDEEKVNVSVQILKDYPDAAAAEAGFATDAKRYTGSNETIPVEGSETEVEVRTEKLQDSYLVIGRFLVKFSQKAGEKDYRSKFIDAYRPVLEKSGGTP
eukprot:g4066.t1